jgi:hypothetical protein
MIKLAKYALDSREQTEAKIKALGVETDEDGNEYPTHGHAIVKLGHIVLEQGEYDEEGNEIKAPVLSDKYHLDVAWKLQDTIDEDGNVIKAEHPYGWKSYAVAIADGNGIHSFYGVDYQKFKL